MTTVASRWSAGVLVVRSTGMTILAIQRSVHAEERKPRRLVALDHVGDFPRLERVATDTVCAEFRSMDVDMARGTELT